MNVNNKNEGILNKKIVKLNGGLGNQMFQYAFACALVNKFKVDILFDFSFFEEIKLNENFTTRVFELDVFNIGCKPAEKEALDKIKRPDFKSKLERSLAKIFPKNYGINYIREKNLYVFDKKLLNSPDYIYYEGYFQNEKYFKHLRSELLNKFSLKVPLDEKNQTALNKILETSSVSIHIRRGDYVNLESTKKIHGTCPLEYYKEAIEYIAKKVKNPHFFLFSDDIDWVIKNLKLEYPFTVIDFNQGKGWFDLNLMKNCKHNIIANSSFSWWGAWLNENPEKIVIAPKKWTLEKRKGNIVPREWIKL